MAKKLFNYFYRILICMLVSVPLTSCGDDDDEPSNSPTAIVGIWICDDSDASYEDVYTLQFNRDYTGYINNSYGSRISKQMNFDWSLTTASDGTYLLSVIYKSGDRTIDGPFSGGYVQYNRSVTIAGKTLSISTGNNTVMLFSRK